MRNRTWQEYNRDLVKRGSITFIIDQECLKSPSKNKRKARETKVIHSPSDPTFTSSENPISDDLPNPGRVRKINASSIARRPI